MALFDAWQGRLACPTARSSQLPDRVLLHVSPLRRAVVEPDDVYLLQADGDDTIVRKRGRRTILDVRPLGEVAAVFSRCGFHRIPSYSNSQPTCKSIHDGEMRSGRAA